MFNINFNLSVSCESKINEEGEYYTVIKVYLPEDETYEFDCWGEIKSREDLIDELKEHGFLIK